MNNKKILIISDSVIDRMVIREYLDQNYVIYEASSGNDALDFLHSSDESIDLILIDISMPTMNAKQVLKLFKSDIELKVLPIVAIVQKDDYNNEVFAFDNGVNDVVFKPFTKQVFISRINNVLRLHNTESIINENNLVNSQLETRDQLQGIMDNMDGGVAMLEIKSSSESSIVYLNNGFYDLFNYAKTEFEKEDTNLISNKYFEDADLLSQKINRSLITKERFSIETKAYQKNKNEIYLQILGSVLSNQKSDFPVVLLIIYDITALKNYEFELVQTNYKLKYRANYDILTNIYNRDAFLDAVQKQIESDINEEFVIISYNFDKFKAVNEILGNKTGDLILKRFAFFLNKEFKENAIYGRIEADRFALFMKLSDFDENKLIYHLDHCFDDMNLHHKVIISAGVYVVNDKTVPASQLLDRADLALKANKHNYINRIAYYNDIDHSMLLEEQEVIAQMQNALKEHQFVLHLQPIYSIEKRCITKAEALVRWNHPQKGLIYPSKFIKIFEDNGFITELDYYVWEEACKYIKSRKERNLDPINISVNISRVNIYRSDFIDKIYNLVKKYDIEPSMLDLEITESAYATNPDALGEVVSKLQEKGFTVLMDDFGAAYSSLNALKDLNFDILKIDMKFLEDFEVSQKSSSILSSIVNMAKNLNMGIVAEGVETTEQLNFLTSLNCDLIQGYLFSKPLSISEFEARPLNFKSFNSSFEFSKYRFLYDNNEITKKTLNLFGPFIFLEYSNEEMKLVNYNDEFLSLLGYNDNDITLKYKDFCSIIYEEDKKKFVEDIAYAIASKKVEASKIRAYHKDGRTLNLDINALAISISDNKALISISLFLSSTINEKNNIIDIRNKSMSEVIPARIVFASKALNTANNLEYSVLYTNNVHLFYNDMKEEDYEKFMSKSFLNFIHPDDKVGLMAAIEDFLENKKSCRTYFRFKDEKINDYIYLVLYLKAAYTSEDTFYFSYALVSLFDLNDLLSLNSKDDIKYSIKSYLKRLYDDYPDMLVQLYKEDGNFKLLFANSKFLDLVKKNNIYDLANYFANNPFPFTSKDNKVKLAKVLSSVMESGKSQNFIDKFYLDDGTYLLVNMSIHRIMGIDGNYILHLLISDVSSESKKAAEVEINKFVSIFGSVYDSIYECDVDSDTYMILRSPSSNLEGTKGNGIRKLVDRLIDDYVYEEDFELAKKFMENVYVNDQNFEKDNAKIRIYRNDKITYGLFNVTRISQTIFMFGYTILNEEKLESESFNELVKKLQTARENEAIYKHAVEAMGVAHINIDGNNTHISHILSMYNIYNIKSLDDLRTRDDIVYPEDKKILLNLLDNLEKNGKAENELRLKNINGDYYYHVLGLNKLVGKDNHIRYYGYAKDIHQAKALNDIASAKKQVSANRNRVLNELMNNLPVSIGVFELVGNKIFPIYLSNNLIYLLGLSYSTIDQNIKERIAIEELDDARKDKLIDLCNQGKTYVYRHYLEGKDGDVKCLSVALGMMNVGEKINIYASILDISSSIGHDELRVKDTNYLKQLVIYANSIYYEYYIEEGSLKYFTLINNDFKSAVIDNCINFIKTDASIVPGYRKPILDAYKKLVMKKAEKEEIEVQADFFGSKQWYKITMDANLDNNGELVKITGQVININDDVIKRTEFMKLIERDQLSALINRISAQNAIVEALKNKNKKYAFLMMDIDYFKSFNDTFGHPVGDKVIIEVARALEKVFGYDNNIVSRFGGDEFAVFIEFNNKKEIEDSLIKLSEQVKEIGNILSLPTNITLSIGLALAPFDADTFDDLFLKADEALYKVKSSGKAHWAWFN